MEMFEIDLEFWKAVEREFATRLLKFPVRSIEFAWGDFKDWDIKAIFMFNWKPLEVTYEVKCDTVFTRTNEVWIEFQYDWTASGIFKSKADKIVYKLGEKIWCVDRAKLLVYLTQGEKIYKSGWDGWKSELWVIPSEEFYKLGREI